MIYGPMMTREHLLGNARIALSPLFAAYADWRERGVAWRQQMAQEIKGSPAIEQTFDTMQHVGMFAIAACIALLADNINRTYVREKIKAKELDRVNFGREIRPNIPFGKVVWAAGNAARHYDGMPLNDWNEQVLGEFNITARDEQAAFLLLEAAGITTEVDLIRELNVVLDGMDQVIQAARAAPQPGP